MPFAQKSMASILSSGNHCVAYKVKKRLMLIRNVEVVGKNCEVISQVIPDIGGMYSYKLEIPIDRFESGEAERDKDVQKALKYEKQDSLYFKSEKMSKKSWMEKLTSMQPFLVNGSLNIGGQDYPITTKVIMVKTDSGFEVDGLIQTKFKELGLKPPALFGGIMAKVREDLELHFHLLSDKTLGFESLQ